MSRLTQAAAVVILLATTMSTTSTARAGSSAQARPELPTVRHALMRIGDGSYSAADLALVRSRPALARQVPDPTATVTTGSSHGRLPRAANARRGSCGWWVDVWFRKRSLLGSTIYTWHHRVVYCRGHGTITRWQNRYDYLTHAASVIYARQQTVNRQWGRHTAKAKSHIQRHLEYCVVRIGCYANTYPWSRITVYGRGGYYYVGSAV